MAVKYIYIKCYFYKLLMKQKTLFDFTELNKYRKKATTNDLIKLPKNTINTNLEMLNVFLPFDPLKLNNPRQSHCDIPLGWSVCRGYVYISRNEADILIRSPPTDSWHEDAAKRWGSKLVYRCPSRRMIIKNGQNIIQRCCFCTRRSRIANHTQHCWMVEPEYDWMTNQDEIIKNLIISASERYSARVQAALAQIVGRLDISAANAASEAMSSFLYEIIDIAYAAQKYANKHDIMLNPNDILYTYSDKIITEEIINQAQKERLFILQDLKNVKYANIKIDAGTVLCTHCTNAILDSPLCNSRYIIDLSENQNWNTQDYEIFITKLLTHLQNQNITICSLIHDNLPAQSIAVKNVLNHFKHLKILDIPCFNHMINLVISNIIKINEDISQCIQNIFEFQKILSKIGYKIPTIPVARWCYMVETLGYILKNKNEIAQIIAENEDAFEDFPCWNSFLSHLMILYKILSPLHSLSLAYERNNFTLPKILSSYLWIQDQWKIALSKIQNESQHEYYNSLLNIVVSYFFARVFNNVYEDVCASFLLSFEGASLVDSLQQNNTNQINNEINKLFEQINIPNPNQFIEINQEILITQENQESKEINEKLKEIEILEKLTAKFDLFESEALSHTQNIKDYYNNLLNVPIDRKLSYDFLLGNSLDLSINSLTQLNSEQSREYYQEKILSFLCKKTQSQRNWEAIKIQSFLSEDFHDMRDFATLAMQYQYAGVSESAVERMISEQRQILGTSMTRISVDVLSARLTLRGKHPIRKTNDFIFNFQNL